MRCYTEGKTLVFTEDGHEEKIVSVRVYIHESGPPSIVIVTDKKSWPVFLLDNQAELKK